MSLFIDSFWIWLGLALLIAVVGGSMYMNEPKAKTLLGTAIATVATLLLGFLIVRYVDSDYKSVSRMLNQLAETIEKDDLPGVKKFISPAAKNTIIKAEMNMNAFRVPYAKVSDLKVEVNRDLSPPVATVQFVAVVRASPKTTTELGDFSGITRVRFTVELERGRDSWLVTDKCDFDQGIGGN